MDIIPTEILFIIFEYIPFSNNINDHNRYWLDIMSTCKKWQVIGKDVFKYGTIWKIFRVELIYSDSILNTELSIGYAFPTCKCFENEDEALFYY